MSDVLAAMIEFWPLAIAVSALFLSLLISVPVAVRAQIKMNENQWRQARLMGDIYRSIKVRDKEIERQSNNLRKNRRGS